MSVHARGGRSLEKSLESHTHYLRLLTPLLTDPAQAADLMRSSGAREYNQG